MLIFKHMCVASDNRTIVVAMLLFVENEYEIGIIVRSFGVSAITLPSIGLQSVQANFLFNFVFSL